MQRQKKTPACNLTAHVFMCSLVSFSCLCTSHLYTDHSSLVANVPKSFKRENVNFKYFDIDYLNYFSFLLLSK